ncbi:MAG TPA: tetratricopeptide repeat protein [Gemmataceae bacterium]|nr:tetratricopeptide repeat protein [Gemmataceae bacterium]
MRWSAIVLLLALPASLPAQDATLQEARARWLHGNYEEARAAYAELAKADNAKPAVFVGWSRAFQSQGEYDKALEIVEKALKDRPDNEELLARNAELLYLRGRWDEAEAAADAAIKKKSEQFLARWIKARVLNDRGKLEDADQAFRWFVRTYSARSEADKDIKDPEELCLVGLAGVENANWHSITDQFNFILNDVYSDVLKADKDYWFGELYAGNLLLEKYNRGEAVSAFDKALKINPRAAEALVGKAIAHSQRFDLKEAEDFANQALKINPKLVDALLVKADLQLLAGDLVKVRELLDEALKVNPRDEHVLGRLAGLYVIQHKADELAKLEKEVTAYDPKPGLLYHECGNALTHRKLLTTAEGYYKKAIALRPNMPWPRDELGLLYMLMGKEAEASKVLDEAFNADRFNVRVANSRKVLEHLKLYETIKTPHFLLRYSPKNDPVLARYMADYLEQLYDNYSKQFTYAPNEPILVEVFNNHEFFSGRVIAVPDLHTIGACTGRMFAMVSPKGRGIRKPFNWGRVLRHELVHIFNLEQTDMQVPHWLTEGLAVSNEGFPRPPLWNQVLAQRVAKNDLLNLDNITLAFVRPKDQLEWTLAYCQSLLYVEYAKKTYGDKVVGQMLAAYIDGLDDAAMLKKVCKVEKADFEKGYRAYLNEVVKGMKVAKTSGKPMTVSELQAAHEKDPEDIEIAAKLAERLLSREPAEARKLAEAVLAKQKDHPKAAVVLAKLEAKAGRTDEAIKALEVALKKVEPDAGLILALGRLYVEGSKLDKAAELFEQGRKVDPYDPVFLEELARLYKKTDDKAKRIAVLTELVATDADEFDQRKLLAQMLLAEGRNAEAEKVAKDALEIDLLDEEVQDVLFKALKAQKKDDEAARIKKLLQD